MIVKLLTEHHLEFLILKRGHRGSSEFTLVKIPHCWNSHVTAHIISDEKRSEIHDKNNDRVLFRILKPITFEPVHEISNNVAF